MNALRSARAGAAIAAAIDALGLEDPEIGELEGGAANRSFRLRDGRCDLVLKLAGDAAVALGASARSELEMQSLAARAGLAPPVLLSDAERGFIVSTRVPGRAPAAAHMKEPGMLRRAGAWLARLHALEPPAALPVVDFGERAAGYLARVRARRSDAFTQRLERELGARRAALPPPARIAACHHDLHHRNLIVDGERLLAVDWEYAGPGDPAADLAALIGYHRLAGGCVDGLLQAYGNGAPAFRARIAALEWIFDCLWFGWNAALGLDGIEPDAREQSTLAARLAR